jgi:predicted Zn-dependent protease with MMP-like domain
MGASPSKWPSGTTAVREPVQHRARPAGPQNQLPDRVGAHNGTVIDMSRDRFEALVSAALDEVPDELAALIDNCVVLVEDEPPDHAPGLLGVYVGTPLTERGRGYTMAAPDTITIFRTPLLAFCSTEEEVVAEVRVTVVHEIAHHFGIDDERLHALGYG